MKYKAENGYRLSTLRVNPYPANHDYSRFYSVLLVNQITVFGIEMCV